MNEKNEVFKKLLPVEELFELYQRLSDTIITKIDVKNLNFDSVALNNSINLLCGVEMIQFNQQKNTFQKTAAENLEYDAFLKILYTRLQSLYSEAFLFFNQTNLKYDEAEAKLYIKRNFVSLDLSGLLMLLDGIKKIEIKQNNIFIHDKGLLSSRIDRNICSTPHRTLEELKIQLEDNEKFGVEAELAAMRYELEILKNAHIEKSPERISEYNTSAGYDIVSFMHIDSLIPDKFIEVKSCSDDNLKFYISKNELDVAKNKKNNYYLYLYNRQNQSFRIIQNPYNYFIKNEEWAIIPQVYQVKLLKNSKQNSK